MKNLKELLEHQLKDLYSAELQLVTALPEFITAANDSEIKIVLTNHFRETKIHKERLENICSELNIDPTGKICKAMDGLIRETYSFIAEEPEEEVLDAGLIGEVQRIEHYEIAGYGTAARYARELGLSNIARELYKTFSEEENVDHLLNGIAESRINQAAIA